jgi:SAM-dependent methyltransferase
MFPRRACLSSSITPILCAQDGKSDMFADARAYERFMGRWSRMVAPQLVDFTDVSALGRLLEVGSGTGALAFNLTEPWIHVRGIDPSKEYIEYPNSRNQLPERVT